MSKILIVDDEQTARNGLCFFLESIAEEIHEADSKDQAEEKLKEHEYDLVITDLRMPKEEQGLALTKLIAEKYPMTPVLVVTAYGSLESAVRAMKVGAEDFISKDFGQEEITLKVKRLLETHNLNVANKQLTKQVKDLKNKVKRFLEPDKFIGQSSIIRAILRDVEKIGKDNESSVLITGESGTGKELIARLIHQSSPTRESHKFMIVDICNITKSLLESQLFGHEKGAFTHAVRKHIGQLENANNGTVFLDEIGDFPYELQNKLLRFLQDKTFIPVGGIESVSSNVRIISATNKNLEDMVKDRLFREDLYYRLNVIPIHLPPLRERPDDIPVLVQYFQNRLESEKEKTLTFSDSAIKKMSEYNWPGNVRQLKNFIERLFVIYPGFEVTAENMQFEQLSLKTDTEIVQNTYFQLPLKEAKNKIIENFEIKYIEQYMHLYNGNITKIAERIGESRENLSRKIHRYCINEKK